MEQISAKDKAKELVEKFLPFMHPFHDVVALKQAKQCALIACREVKESIPKNNGWQTTLEYWQDVENEINQL